MKTLPLPHLAALLFSAAVAHAQVNLSTVLSVGPYTQNFDSLGGGSGTWTDNSTLPGWYAASNTGGTVTGSSAFTTTGGGGVTSGVLYNFGATGSDTDRSLGGSPSTATTTLLGLQLDNDTGSVINNIQLSYDLKQWNTIGVDSITMSYQIFTGGTNVLTTTTGWTALTTTTSPITSNVPHQTGIGNTAAGQVAGITADLSALNLQPDQYLWVEWIVAKVSGSNAGNSIDNVIVAVPEPSTLAFAGLGFLVLLGTKCFRRRAI